MVCAESRGSTKDAARGAEFISGRKDCGQRGAGARSYLVWLRATREMNTVAGIEGLCSWRWAMDIEKSRRSTPSMLLLGVWLSIGIDDSGNRDISERSQDEEKGKLI